MRDKFRIRNEITEKVRKTKRIKNYYIDSMANFTKKTGERIRGKIEDIADIFNPVSYIKISGREYDVSEFVDAYIVWKGNKSMILVNPNQNA